jgi:hypothetical protein
MNGRSFWDRITPELSPKSRDRQSLDEWEGGLRTPRLSRMRPRLDGR